VLSEHSPAWHHGTHAYHTMRDPCPQIAVQHASSSDTCSVKLCLSLVQNALYIDGIAWARVERAHRCPKCKKSTHDWFAFRCAFLSDTFRLVNRFIFNKRLRCSVSGTESCPSREEDAVFKFARIQVRTPRLNLLEPVEQSAIPAATHVGVSEESLGAAAGTGVRAS
jgi:hypothetical protein